jgi:hypothetical protein
VRRFTTVSTAEEEYYSRYFFKQLMKPIKINISNGVWLLILILYNNHAADIISQGCELRDQMVSGFIGTIGA